MIKNIVKKTYKFLVKNLSFKYDIKYNTEIDGIYLQFYDSIISRMVKSVSEEINNGEFYDFSSISFLPGDNVIDIGGNIGIVSIYLAKKYPFLKIYAFEPVRENYENFKRNIKLNKIPDGTIFLEHKAVTKDGRLIDMSINAVNTGGSSITTIAAKGSIRQKQNIAIPSITLSAILKKYNLESIKMLKIDCEGSEYEILYNTNPEDLNKVKMIRGEFHENKQITEKYDADTLLTYTQNSIKDTKIKISRDCFIM